jgi:hypothetical protein
MSRGMLDDSDWEPYVKELPDLSKLQEMVNQLSSPDILSISCLDKDSYQSLFPVASVCFRDAHETLWGACYALSEIFAHNIWYLKKKTPQNEMAAALFGRFYADDAALRLYAAGEHLANGIIMMLGINDEELKPYKDKGKRRDKRISQQSIVGNYLRKEKPSHPITKSVIRLSDSKEWLETITYRNKWVHEQPPTIKGLGIVYKRRIRWEPTANGKGYTLQAGGGDEPEYSVDELVKFIKPAMFQFRDTLTSVIEFYKELLQNAGRQTV